MKRLTEEKTDDRNETSSESDDSIHHIKEIKENEEKSKHFTETLKINEIKKELIIVTGSPIMIMPPDEKVLKLTRTHKITNRYQDVNINDVKFPGKLPVNLENKKK